MTKGRAGAEIDKTRIMKSLSRVIKILFRLEYSKIVQIYKVKAKDKNLKNSQF